MWFFALHELNVSAAGCRFRSSLWRVRTPLQAKVQ